MRSFFPIALNLHVQLVLESMVTVHIVRNFTSRSPGILANLLLLRGLCEPNDITISTRHLPSVLHCWPYRLSRRWHPPDWSLSRDARFIPWIERAPNCTPHPYKMTREAGAFVGQEVARWT